MDDGRPTRVDPDHRRHRHPDPPLMPDDITLVELARWMQRLEAAVSAHTVKVDTAILNQAINRTKIDALEADVAELKERERFRARAVVTAVVTALAGPVLILFQVKK